MTTNKRKGGQVVGFVITPGEIQNRINALDTAIALLDGDVRASKAKRLDEPWRDAWDAFRRRWAIERDSYASWDSRLFATRVMPRLEDFENSYREWAKQYQQRAKVAPRVADPAPQTGMADALVPTEMWWLMAGAVALFIWSRK